MFGVCSLRLWYVAVGNRKWGRKPLITKRHFFGTDHPSGPHATHTRSNIDGRHEQDRLHHLFNLMLLWLRQWIIWCVCTNTSLALAMLPCTRWLVCGYFGTYTPAAPAWSKFIAFAILIPSFHLLFSLLLFRLWFESFRARVTREDSVMGSFRSCQPFGTRANNYGWNHVRQRRRYE